LPLTILGQEMSWAYTTMLLSPNEAIRAKALIETGLKHNVRKHKIVLSDW